MKRLDVRFDEKLGQLFDSAIKSGKWKATSASQGRPEYWATGVLAYFDALGQDAAPDDATHPIRTREALKNYDPELYALVNETMAYDGHVDWRFEALPTVDGPTWLTGTMTHVYINRHLPRLPKQP